ncbi:MAG: site-specific recombinase [Burkholderiales bacterium]
MKSASELHALLARLDANSPLAQRHLWLIDLLDWIRGSDRNAPAAVARLVLLMDALQAQPDLLARFRAWWQRLGDTLDTTTLMADYGFAPRSGFFSEFADRMRLKLLPATPETADAAELFALVLHGEFDRQWLALLDEPQLQRLALLLRQDSTPGLPAPAPNEPSPWQHVLLQALTFCTSQVCATGFSPELRLRMNHPAQDQQPFHALSTDLDAVNSAFLHCVATADAPAGNAALHAASHQFKERLDACRQAASSVYTHLDENGISVGLVFRLRQLRQRVLRIRDLLDCLLTAQPAQHTRDLLCKLITLQHERSSIRELIASNSSLLAAKVAERSAETGESYITRNRAEYRGMLAKAAGGGAATSLTTLLKFALGGLGLAAFWGGVWAGAMYAASFVFIQLMHWTLATKQPAMTAPAMAAKVKDLSTLEAVEEFVDEVSHLVRSQVAAVLGNVGLVVPCVVLISVLLMAVRGSPMLNTTQAWYVLESLDLLRPSTLLFAGFTGVLLFASSLIAGWAENFFVLHRLHSALRYNPRITAVLGQPRAERWARFMRDNISGLASNISLGFMLGLIPPVLGFIGLGLDVRHVTLSAGQLAAAVASLGIEAWRLPQVWWCVAAIPLIGVLNLSVSFYLAFSLALQAHNVSNIDRGRIRTALWARWRRYPRSFFLPP